jgi:hypothetical protein
MAQGADRDVFFIFGSACRVLTGKVSPKDWKAPLQDLWQWSLQTVRDLNENHDVPHYPQPAATLPPPPQNGTDDVSPPPAEKPVVVPNPAPIPIEQKPSVQDVVYLSDEQIVRFTAYAYSKGLSELGLVKYLKTKGIPSPSKIPLSQARHLWNELQEPLITQQFK